MGTWAWPEKVKDQWPSFVTNSFPESLFFFVKRDPADIMLNKRDVVIIRQTFSNGKPDFFKSCSCVLEKITINSFVEFILYLHIGAI